MKFSKQLSITLAAAVLAVGAVTIAPQQAEASPGYYYTDSKRPPVLTAPGYVEPIPSTPKVGTVMTDISVPETIVTTWDALLAKMAAMNEQILKMPEGNRPPLMTLDNISLEQYTFIN